MNEEVIYHEGVNGMSWPLDATFENEESLKELSGVRIYINIRTLIRNALNAYDDKDNLLKSKDTIKDRIDSDITLFKQYMLDSYDSTVIVYDVNYNNVKNPSFVKLVTEKEKKTDKQKIMESATETAYKLVREFADKYHSFEFSNLDPTDKRKAFIMTHLPIDLLRANSFNSLKLLNSFNGDIKTFDKFNSKLNIAKELRELIPLNKITLRVFGDTHMFLAQPKGVRDKLVEIAKKSNWTPMTTESRIMFSIRKHDKPLYDILSSIH